MTWMAPVGLAACVVGALYHVATRTRSTDLLDAVDRMPIDSARLRQLRDRAGSIPGWLKPTAAERLYKLARIAPLGSAIELGSWQGRSTPWIAAGVMDRCEHEGRGQTYAVDTWRGSDGEAVHRQSIDQMGGPSALFDAFRANMFRAGVADVVVPVRTTTLKAARDPRIPQCGLLYIDADHSLEGVHADYHAWLPRVVPGGFVVFDDVPSWTGPTSVARGIAERDLEFVGEIDNHWIGRR